MPRELNERQRHILRHALNSDTDAKPYRNHYVSTWDDDLQDLVYSGDMDARTHDLVRDTWVFRVTEQGAAAVGLELPSD